MTQNHEMQSAQEATRPSQIKPAHLRKLAIVYIRQSSPGQVRDHVGSLLAQRQLADVARRWGWAQELIKLIEADLGVTAKGGVHRAGFDEMLDLVSQGKVGLVIVRNVDRLSRNNLDGLKLFDALTRTGTLVEADGRLYDPQNGDDETFILHLLGLLAWRENRQRARMMMAARIAKARQGFAVSAPSIGYVASRQGQWIKDPNPEVQAAVGRVFGLYLRLGSLGRVVKFLKEQGLHFPRRRNGLTDWKPLDPTHLYSILTNPSYTGTYVFGRHESDRTRDAAERRPRFRPPSEWHAVRKAHHDAYVSQEDWERIQTLLSSRRLTTRPIAGKGHALLQRLIRCECGKRLETKYWGHEGTARTASYRCHRKNGWGEVTHKVVLPARLLDGVVVREVVARLTPLEIHAAAAEIRNALVEDLDLDRARRRQLQEAQDRIDQIEESYLKADSRNARVKLHLEEQLEEALGQKHAMEERFRKPAQQPAMLSENDAEELAELTTDIKTLWDAPTTTNDDRKALLGALLSEIRLLRATPERIELDLLWVGGLHQPITVLRAKGVESAARAQHAAGTTLDTIVENLHKTGATTAFGQPLSRSLIKAKLRGAAPTPTPRRRAALALIRERLMENERPCDIRARLNEKFAELGPWTPQRVADAVCQLRAGTLGLEPLPEVLPAEVERQNVLRAIASGLAAGKGWAAMARELNASDLRPPRGAQFTPIQVRLLYLRNEANTRGAR